MVLVDIINQQKVTATNDPNDLLSRIDQQRWYSYCLNTKNAHRTVGVF